MEMPVEDTPPKAYPPRSAYTIARVAADPQTKGLESALETAHVALQQALRNGEDLEYEEQKKTAVLDTKDEHNDDDVEGFELSLLAHVKKNRNDPRYIRYFPNGLREITTADPRKEGRERIEQMLETMAQDAADASLGPLVAVWAPKIKTSLDEVIAADESLVETEKALAFLNEKTIPALMATWRNEYKKLEGALTGVYASNPKKVDRFFKPFRRRQKTNKKAETKPVPVAPVG
jgi:hypothetical protein